MGTAQAQARRRAARTRETVTLRTLSRSVSVDAATGLPVEQVTAEAPNIPAVIYDETNTAARDADPQRDINVKTFVVKVPAGTRVLLGQQCEWVDARDEQMGSVTGTVTTVGRSGSMWRQFTVTTERTP